MNKFVNAAIVGSAALAVGLVPVAATAYAATAPTPPPVTSVVAPPITTAPGHHTLPVPGSHIPVSHAPGSHLPGARGTGAHAPGSHGAGSGGSGSHGTGSHGTGSRGTGSHGTGSRGSGSRGHGSSGRGSHPSGSRRTPSPRTPSPRVPSARVPGHRTPSPRVPNPGTAAHRTPSHRAPAHRTPVRTARFALDAQPTTATPGIVDGTDATNALWAAQVDWDGMGFQCSGTVVAPSWVLTAGHCANKGGMSVRVGSLQLDEGDQTTVDRVEADTNADLALLHLSSPTKAPAVQLATADPKSGAINQIYGWGMTGPDSGPAEQLKVAKVKVTGLDCVDAAQGPAICSTGMTGAAYNGDSGGPEMAGGQEVGVCSTGDEHVKTAQYASVAANRPWIKQVAGV